MVPALLNGLEFQVLQLAEHIHPFLSGRVGCVLSPVDHGLHRGSPASASCHQTFCGRVSYRASFLLEGRSCVIQGDGTHLLAWFYNSFSSFSLWLGFVPPLLGFVWQRFAPVPLHCGCPFCMESARGLSCFLGLLSGLGGLAFPYLDWTVRFCNARLGCGGVASCFRVRVQLWSVGLDFPHL